MSPCRSTFLLVFCLANLASPSFAADLLELYNQAMMTHPAIKGSEFYIEQARAQKDQAFSKLLPQVSATGNLSRNAMSQDQATGPSVDSSYKSTRGILQAKQALFDMPSFKRWEGSKLAILQSEQELGVARMSITADLIDQYLKALETEDRLQYLQGEKALTEGDMKRISRMREMQMAKVTDLYEVEAYYQALLTKELEVIGEKDIALAKLRETTGIDITSLQKLDDTDLPAVAGGIDQWVEKSMSSHPSLLAMNYAVEGAQKFIESARAEHWPQLSLQLSETYADNGGYDNRQLPPYSVSTIGIQASIPIYAGGGIEAGARDARARYNQTLEKRNTKTREIEKEIRTAYVQARTSHARIQSTAKEVQARKKSRDAMDKSYELGVATIVDLLEAKKNLLKTRFEHAQSRYEFIRSLVALKLWSGNLDDRDVEEINRWLIRQ